MLSRPPAICGVANAAVPDQQRTATGRYDVMFVLPMYSDRSCRRTQHIRGIPPNMHRVVHCQNGRAAFADARTLNVAWRDRDAVAHAAGDLHQIHDTAGSSYLVPSAWSQS